MLYVVATPVGNLADITLRALEVLKSVDLIACEDTRETLKLLSHYGISRPLVSYYRENERRRIGRLVGMLAEGTSIALVCDRGTPGISDPAFLLVKEARACGIPVVPVPGPSSLTAGLSVCGLPTDRVSYFGFLPRKPGKRRRLLESLADREETLVFFESVHRAAATVSELAEVLGDREAAVCRELTKKFEEIKTGRLGDLAAWFRESPRKGEFVVIVSGKD